MILGSYTKEKRPGTRKKCSLKSKSCVRAYKTHKCLSYFSLPFVLKRGVVQWRNSYGLRVGKPAGTRAEGGTRRLPLYSSVTAKIRPTLSKGAPFKATRLFGSKILMHYIIDEIRIIWVPLQLRLRGAGADNIANVKIYVDVPPKWANSTQKKSGKHGSHFDPHASKKKSETCRSNL